MMYPPARLTRKQVTKWETVQKDDDGAYAKNLTKNDNGGEQSRAGRGTRWHALARVGKVENVAGGADFPL